MTDALDETESTAEELSRASGMFSPWLLGKSRASNATSDEKTTTGEAREDSSMIREAEAHNTVIEVRAPAFVRLPPYTQQGTF